MNLCEPTLDKELSFFEKELPRLLNSPDLIGKHILIKEDQIIGIFEAREIAIAEGLRLFYNTGFMVKRVEPEKTYFVARSVRTK